MSEGRFFKRVTTTKCPCDGSCNPPDHTRDKTTPLSVAAVVHSKRRELGSDEKEGVRGVITISR